MLAIVFLIVPNVELAFFTALTHCHEDLATFCIITPKFLFPHLGLLTFNILPHYFKHILLDRFSTPYLEGSTQIKTMLQNKYLRGAVEN